MILVDKKHSCDGDYRHFFVHIDGEGNGTGMVVIENAMSIRSDVTETDNPRTFVEPDGGPFIDSNFRFGGINGAAIYQVSGPIMRVSFGVYTFPVTQH